MSVSTTRLYLVRHAATRSQDDDRCRGRTPVPLSAAGRQQARRLAAVLTGQPLAAIFSSPATRAMATAQPISEAVGRKVAIVDELDEMNFGELEGRTFQEIAISRPLLYERWMTTPTAVHFPGGESFDAMRTRSLAAVGRIRRVHAAASVLAVSHAGPIRAILGDVLQLPDSSMFRLEISPASITVIDWIDDQPIVRLVNMVPGAAALALTSRTDSEESAIATKMLGDVRTPA